MDVRRICDDVGREDSRFALSSFKGEIKVIWVCRLSCLLLRGEILPLPLFGHFRYDAPCRGRGQNSVLFVSLAVR